MAAAKKKKSGARKKGPDKAKSDRALTEALGAASWADADLALAAAITSFEAACLAKVGAEREQWLALLGQALTRAARKRGLTRLGVAGEEVRYDAAHHELIRPVARAPSRVRVLCPGVGRGEEQLAAAIVQVAP